jgi:hypothetical protein
MALPERASRSVGLRCRRAARLYQLRARDRSTSPAIAGGFWDSFFWTHAPAHQFSPNKEMPGPPSSVPGRLHPPALPNAARAVPAADSDAREYFRASTPSRRNPACGRSATSSIRLAPASWPLGRKQAPQASDRIGSDPQNGTTHRVARGPLPSPLGKLSAARPWVEPAAVNLDPGQTQ